MPNDLKCAYFTDISTTDIEIEVFQQMIQRFVGKNEAEIADSNSTLKSDSHFSQDSNAIAVGFDSDFKEKIIRGNTTLFCPESAFEDNLIVSVKFDKNLNLEIQKYLDNCKVSLSPLLGCEIKFGESQKKALLNVLPYFVNAENKYLVTIELVKQNSVQSNHIPQSNKISDTSEVISEILTDNQSKDLLIVDQNEQLVAARTYSESIMETVREGLLVLDKDFLIITANQAFHQCFDTEHEEIISKSFFEINENQWDFKELRELFNQILPKHHIIESYKVTLLLRNNKKRTLMLNARQILSEDKKDLLILVAIEDITKSKLLKTERDFSKTLEIEVAEKTKELEQSQAFLNSILDSTRYGIASYEAIFKEGEIIDFLITYTNAEVPRMFDLTIEDVLGKTCTEVYSNIFIDGVFEKFVQCIKTGESISYEIEYQIPKGSMWISSIASKVENSVTVTSKINTTEKNAELYLKQLNEDLTAKNKAFEERILQEFSDSFSSYKTGQDFFNSLVMELSRKTEMDYVLLGEVVQGDEGKFVRCFSVAAKGKLEKNFEYLINNGPCQKILKGTPYMQTHAVQELFPENQLLLDLNADGYIGYPLFNHNKKCIGLISVMHQTKIENLSYVRSFVHIASKRIELELQRQVNENILEEKNRELKYNIRELQSFNYIASHDLQEPLRKIQLFTGRILEQDEQNFSDLSVKYFNTVRNAAGRMQNLIQALLSYSTSDAKGMEFKRTNLNKILEDIKIELEEKIQNTNATIICDTLPTLSVIPVQFHQLLQNLISNGIKYHSPELNPVITITSEKVPDQEDETRKMWRICVRDNGIGFEEQYKNKIFELFQRLHGKNEYEGTGIGLAICKKIVQNHKGYIKVTSEVGKGSNFCIFVPTKT